MSDIFLSKIDDVFNISGRGIILAPGFPVSDYKFDGEYDVFIKEASRIKKCRAVFIVPFQSPPPRELCYFCHLSGIIKAEIPVGSELWLSGVETSNIFAQQV